MREIKFRAWNTRCKKMIDLYNITPLALDKGMLGYGLYIPFDENLELMQYTGLKDKNGKEIYEGDIVQYSYRALIEKRTVRYDEQSASFQMDISDYVLDQEGSYPEDLEVIGNIYENREMLK